MTGTLTFRQLDCQSNISDQPVADSALDEWYHRVRDVPLQAMDDGDLSRACRQRFHLDHIVPISVRRLRSFPLAGELYYGELLAAMKSIPVEYWHRNALISREMGRVLDKVKQVSADVDILSDAADVGRQIRCEA